MGISIYPPQNEYKTQIKLPEYTDILYSNAYAADNVQGYIRQLVNVSGSGLLYKALSYLSFPSNVGQPSTYTAYNKLRIMIDGKIFLVVPIANNPSQGYGGPYYFFNASGITNDLSPMLINNVGLRNVSKLLSSGTICMVGHLTGNISTGVLPTTAGTSIGFFINQPIVFNSSLIIEAITENVSGHNPTLLLEIQYALKK